MITYKDEDIWSEDVVVCGYDNGLVTKIIAEMLFHPLGIEADRRVLGGPQGDIIVFFGPEEKATTEAYAEKKCQSDSGPRMHPDEVPQSLIPIEIELKKNKTRIKN